MRWPSLVHESLQKLQGTIQSAANNFAIGSQSLSYWSQQLHSLEDAANAAFWQVAQKRAVERLGLQQQLDAAKKFRSEPQVVETAEERQSREFMNRLQDPHDLNRLK